MEKIIWFWNLVHYNIFIWRNKLSNFLLKPFFLLLGSRAVKRLYEKRGVSDPDLLVKDAILNPVNGSNSFRSGSSMGVLVLLICIAFFQIYTGFFGTKFNTNVLQLPVYIAIILVVNHYTLFKENRYLRYFEEFSKMPREQKTRYGWISFGFILLIVLFLIGSFMFAAYMFRYKNAG